MSLCYLDGQERLKEIKRAQEATIGIAEEWAEIIELDMPISKELSLADLYQTYKRIKLKVKDEITNDEVICLRIMKQSIEILLEVWKYKDSLLNVITEVNERFEPMLGNCNHMIARIFSDNNYKIVSHEIDTMILLFESDLQVEYKGNLQNELAEIYTQTVSTLIDTIDIKDSYTRGHIERVSIIAECFGKTLKLSKENLDELVFASKLHDVGKIGVSEAILTKEGSLSSEEYDEIKKHTQYGEQIVKGIPGFRKIANIIKYHHERYDGKGYYNLSHELIPKNAYIISLCDSFDAMNSNRSYRSSLNFNTIIDEYRRCSGKQFEPILCEKFINFLSDNTENLKETYR